MPATEGNASEARTQCMPASQVHAFSALIDPCIVCGARERPPSFRDPSPSPPPSPSASPTPTRPHPHPHPHPHLSPLTSHLSPSPSRRRASSLVPRRRRPRRPVDQVGPPLTGRALCGSALEAGALGLGPGAGLGFRRCVQVRGSGSGQGCRFGSGVQVRVGRSRSKWVKGDPHSPNPKPDFPCSHGACSHAQTVHGSSHVIRGLSVAPRRRTTSVEFTSLSVRNASARHICIPTHTHARAHAHTHTHRSAPRRRTTSARHICIPPHTHAHARAHTHRSAPRRRTTSARPTTRARWSVTTPTAGWLRRRPRSPCRRLCSAR